MPGRSGDAGVETPGTGSINDGFAHSVDYRSQDYYMMLAYEPIGLVTNSISRGEYNRDVVDSTKVSHRTQGNTTLKSLPGTVGGHNTRHIHRFVLSPAAEDC
jgi:hypothetical protein